MPRNSMKPISAKLPPHVERKLRDYCSQNAPKSKSEAIRELLERALYEQNLAHEVSTHHERLREELHALVTLIVANLPNRPEDPEEIVTEVLEYAAHQQRRVPR